MPDNKVWQEWYCTVSGGGCGGYISTKINIGIKGVVEMICPKCGHRHQRKIVNGMIKEQGRFTSNPSQEICPTMAAYSKEPRTVSLKEMKGNERDGVKMSSDELQAQAILNESKNERWLGKLFGRK